MQFNMPVEVTWHKISDQLLKAFWARHPEERKGLATISDHILVFHRGIKEVLLKVVLFPNEERRDVHHPRQCPFVRMQVRARGLFINEKIDLLTQYLVVNPLSALLVKWAPTLRQYVKQVIRTVPCFCLKVMLLVLKQCSQVQDWGMTAGQLLLGRIHNDQQSAHRGMAGTR